MSALGIKGVDMSKVNLGVFDSNVLKISWFRFAQIAGEVQVDGKTMTKPIRYEPQWFGIFSHGWLRERGYRAGEDYLKHVRDLKTVFNDMGFPNADVRQMVGYLMTKAHLMELPEASPAMLSEEWFKRIEKMPVSPDTWNREVGFVKILVVESDKGRRVMLHYSFRNDPGLLAKSRVLHTEAARLMSTFAPEIGGRRTDEK